MSSSKKSKAPKGFTFIDWKDVPVHAVVFRPHRTDTPYRVIDPDQRILQKLAGTVAEPVDDPVLVVQDGPVVVLTTIGSDIKGFYTDMPLTVYQYDLALHRLTQTRPKSFDGLPGEAQLVTRAVLGTWPPFYGSWTVVESTKQENLVSFEIQNRLAVNALTSEMIRTGRQFKVTPNQLNVPSSWVIMVTRLVYNWIFTTCADHIAATEAMAVCGDFPLTDQPEEDEQ